MAIPVNTSKSCKPAVVVKSLHKEFSIPHEKRTTLFENIKSVFKPSSYERFVALDDITFVVEKGDSLGIIGDNGSGKSTLLKIIAGILRPTSGTIQVNGKITPFLELGVGFQPDLTAKENIEVYSTVLGLTDKEISRNMDSVLEFAGLTRFKDAKLKNFSSGMQVRLAFATAIQKTPDILLVDEVLAVGDMEFQQKCLDVFEDYKKRGITMIFVSHDLNSVRKFCNKTLLIKNGQQIAYGETNDIIDRYIYGRSADTSSADISDVPVTSEEARVNVSGPSETDPTPIKKLEITDVKFIDKFGRENTSFVSGDPLTIRIYYVARERLTDLCFGVLFYTDTGVPCFGTNTLIKKCDLGIISGTGWIDFVLGNNPMYQGKYYLTVAAHTKDNKTYDWREKSYTFTMHNPTQNIGLFDIPCKWEIK